MAPNGARKIFVPTNPDLADILGDTDFDFENFYFLDFLDPGLGRLGWALGWAGLGGARVGWARGPCVSTFTTCIKGQRTCK